MGEEARRRVKLERKCRETRKEAVEPRIEAEATISQLWERC